MHHTENIIRQAKPEDAAEIANVHINSWREAYADLLPQDFLNNLPLRFKNRYEMWKKLTNKKSEIIYVVESKNHGIVGFASAGPGRHPESTKQGEIYAIYLLRHYQQQGLGFALLKKCFYSLSLQGYSEVYLWVLKNNPTIQFYERAGAKLVEGCKDANIGGQDVQELCYKWDKTTSFIT